MKKLEKTKKNIKKENNVGVMIEAELLILLVYFLILSAIIPDFYTVVEFIVSFLLLDMSYNNFYVDHKSKLGIIYLTSGIIMLVTTVITYVR